MPDAVKHLVWQRSRSREAGSFVPDAIRHLNVFVPIDFAGQLKFTIKTLCCEQTLQESVEQTLIELIVHSSAIDGLGHQGLQCGPWDLIWRDVLPPLCEEGWVLWGPVGGALAQPGSPSSSSHPHQTGLPAVCHAHARSERSPPISDTAARTCLRRVIQPRVHRVTGRAQVRFPKFILLRPAQGCVS